MADPRFETVEISSDDNTERVEVVLSKKLQIRVQFLAVAGAPILKKNKFQVRNTMSVGEVSAFLRKTLKIREGDPLLIYLCSSFAPSLEQNLGELYDQFKVNDELVIQYAITKSWG